MKDKPNKNHMPGKGWQVVNQKEGRIKPAKQSQAIAIKGNEGLEKEADELGKAANQKELLD